MYYQDHFLLIGVLISIILFVCLLFKMYRLDKRLDVFLRDGDKDIEGVLKSLIIKSKKQSEDIKSILESISRLDKISQKSFQKMGIVRFNPFNETGGNQSFSIALLDAEKNGFVITSHYSREANRVYAKPIIGGESQYSLSDEEKRAISQALGL